MITVDRADCPFTAVFSSLWFAALAERHHDCGLKVGKPCDWDASLVTVADASSALAEVF